ncbi:hypothetical protein N657DRAFT_280382 [Parathielavia appendiculata]|uniref:Uncharacterized protein n=1 Tax=Parathielavia appendiculata TaxID=2587402 RepID=A0AAN6U4S9_9PEZI|nr:hypothetical protein N657DRAFT_280382 [Parathielavia appendiculata]
MHRRFPILPREMELPSRHGLWSVIVILFPTSVSIIATGSGLSYCRYYACGELEVQPRAFSRAKVCSVQALSRFGGSHV